MKDYYVYILTNNAGVLYIGVTNNLERRIAEHKSGLVPGFTQRYGLKILVYFEATSDVNSAIAREKQLKGWTRAKKNKLIESVNSGWQDLSMDTSAPLSMTVRQVSGAASVADFPVKDDKDKDDKLHAGVIK